MRKILMLAMVVMFSLSFGLAKTHADATYDVQITGQIFGDVNSPDVTVQTTTPNDPFYGQQLSLRRLKINQAWDITKGSSSIIAVIDTGANKNHQDLVGRIWANQDEIPNNNKDDDGNGYVDDYWGYNFFDNNININDGHGHGTGIASIIAAHTNNGQGLAGIDWSSKIMVLKALDNLGGGDFEDVAEAIRYAVDNGASIINMSFGSNSNDGILAAAIEYAISHNVVVVAASGNNSNSEIFYPARYPQVIAVGSVDYQDRLSTFSNYGSNLDLVAPGENIIMAGLDIDGYVEGAGSSFAAAQVSGIASLILSQNLTASPAQVQSILTSTASAIGTGESIFFGWGRPDALSAVQTRIQTAKSDITSNVASVAADGVTSIHVSATLVDKLGRLIQNHPIALDITGTNNIINGQVASFGQMVDLGNSDNQGHISFNISSNRAEIKQLQLFDKSSNQSVTDKLTLTFLPLAAKYQMQWIRQSPYPTLALGADATLWVDIKNVGNVVWVSEPNAMNDTGQIRLGTDRTKDRSSQFYHSSWISQNRVTHMTPNIINPGETGRFTFIIKASQLGSFREYFGVVAERITWLNDLGIYWDINVTNSGNVDASTSGGTPLQINYDATAYQAKIQSKTASMTVRPGEKINFSVSFRNIGSALWLSQGLSGQDTGQLRIGTVAPRDRNSSIVDSSWLSPNRAVAAAYNVPPNTNLFFDFTGQAPSQPGIYQENFQLVAERITWFGPVFSWTINVV